MKKLFAKSNFETFLCGLNKTECSILWFFMIPCIATVSIIRYIKGNVTKIARAMFSMLFVFIVLATMCHVRTTAIEREKRIAEAKENVEFVTITAGSHTGEFYTWWEIASVYCPDYMIVDNFKTGEENYLNYLYEVNGGKHQLQRGEVVKVPILK